METDYPMRKDNLLLMIAAKFELDVFLELLHGFKRAELL